MIPLPEKVAEVFHESYERLAPRFGYEAREDTRAFDKNSPNGQLMIAVCKEVLDWMDSEFVFDSPKE